MDGGCLSIPCDKSREFSEIYVKAVSAGERVFVVEQKTTHAYNFFVDVDYKSDESLTMEEVEDICKIVCAKVKNHGGKEALVSAAPPKDAGNGQTKYGIHINFPGLVVDQQSAVNLREHILCALYTMKPSRDWDKIIDSAVYGDPARKSKGSGFRMPWSHKKGKCVSCNGGKREGCLACEGTGKRVEDPYYPIYRWGRFTGLLAVEQKPSVELLEMATVRTTKEPTHTIESPTRVVRQEGAFATSETKDEFADETARAALQAFVQRHMEGQGDAVITKMFRQKNGTLLVSTNSHYCENIGRPHGSNHVWFFVSGEWIAQKCFCRCETIAGRANGFCKDFIGGRKTMPEELVRALYPPSETKPTQLPKLEARVPLDARTGLKEKCPSEKRKEDKERLDAAKTKVQQFIQAQFKTPTTHVLRVSRGRGNKLIVTTSSNVCSKKTKHEKTVPYEITKVNETGRRGNVWIREACGCKNPAMCEAPEFIKKIMRR